MISGENKNTLIFELDTNIENLEVSKDDFLNALKFQMRNVARIGDKLVVYRADNSIVGVFAEGVWEPAEKESDDNYEASALVETKDLTLAEVKAFVNTRFKADHNNQAAVNDNDITVSIVGGNLVVTFPTNFVSYGDGENDTMPVAGYNVTAHLDYAGLFTDLEVEGNYSFKIKSYDAKGNITVVLEEL